MSPSHIHSSARAIAWLSGAIPLTSTTFASFHPKLDQFWIVAIETSHRLSLSGFTGGVPVLCLIPGECSIPSISNIGSIGVIGEVNDWSGWSWVNNIFGLNISSVDSSDMDGSQWRIVPLVSEKYDNSALAHLVFWDETFEGLISAD